MWLWQRAQPRRRTEPDLAGRGDSIGDRIDTELFLVGATFLIDQRIAVETGGDNLVGGGAGKQVARQLLDRELVEQEIAVECGTAMTQSRKGQISRPKSRV
ncbi:MAG: hypothetical protein U0935_20450 [Pirellulales bacterium]